MLNQFLFPHPSVALQEGFMKVYTISTKPSSSAREKRENKISSHFEQKDCILWGIRGRRRCIVREVMSNIFFQKMKY